MSATTPPGVPRVMGRSPSPRALRFGHESGGTAGEWAVEWTLKRNCSLAPRQLLWFYAVLCGLSLAVATFFWWQGARLVMPFTWAELVAVGVAMLVYARHAGDNEHIALRGGRLTVEHAWGGRRECVEFAPQWVRVEPEAGDESLVELSGQGQRVWVGRYLRPELRRQLADELRMALRHPGLGGPTAAQ